AVPGSAHPVRLTVAPRGTPRRHRVLMAPTGGAGSPGGVEPRTARHGRARGGKPRVGARPSGGPRPRAESRLDVAHHVFDAGVVLQPVHRQVLAVSGVLEAAVR